jgi:hypothetical protein
MGSVQSAVLHLCPDKILLLLEHYSIIKLANPSSVKILATSSFNDAGTFPYCVPPSLYF